MATMRETEMRRFWNARAREDAFYFVDTRRDYRASDPRAFSDAKELLDYFRLELERVWGEGSQYCQVLLRS
jgi:hypothetical protein